MAYKVIWSADSIKDIEAIAAYIARDSRRYADVFVRDAIDAGRSLAWFPMRGRAVPELNDPLLREYILLSYRMIYRFEAQTVRISAVVHGSRDLRSFWTKKKTKK